MSLHLRKIRRRWKFRRVQILGAERWNGVFGIAMSSESHGGRGSVTLACDGVRRRRLISSQLEPVPRVFLACSLCYWQWSQRPDCLHPFLPPSLYSTPPCPSLPHLPLWAWIAAPSKQRDADYVEQHVLGEHQLPWCAFSCLHIVEQHKGWSPRCPQQHTWEAAPVTAEVTFCERMTRKDGGHGHACHRKHHEYEYM